jgi:hypothetical protein
VIHQSRVTRVNEPARERYLTWAKILREVKQRVSPLSIGNASDIVSTSSQNSVRHNHWIVGASDINSIYIDTVLRPINRCCLIKKFRRPFKLTSCNMLDYQNEVTSLCTSNNIYSKIVSPRSCILSLNLEGSCWYRVIQVHERFNSSRTNYARNVCGIASLSKEHVHSIIQISTSIEVTEVSDELCKGRDLLC